MSRAKLLSSANRSWKAFGALCLLWGALAVASSAQSLRTLAYFEGQNGASPYAGLTQGLDGNFYGTTFYGGGQDGFCSGAYDGCGSIFKITPSGTLTTLYAFCSRGNCPYGENPAGTMVRGADGNFYGTTSAGGYSYGTVFKITPSGVLTTLYNFDGTQGVWPMAGLILATDGNFWGTTAYGGPRGGGTVFKITPDGTLTTVYTFCLQGGDCSDGARPEASLVQGNDGNFYGTTASGGGFLSFGTIFKVTPQGTLTTLHEFNLLDDTGEFPKAGLVQGRDGNFYGTSSQGGGLQYGTVFKITPDGVLTTLWNFSGFPDGDDPEAPLVQGSDGNFYGTTRSGGYYNSGTIFEISPSGRKTQLYNFDVIDGAQPRGELLQGTNGYFYGTTSYGPAAGTVFSLAFGLPQLVDIQPTFGSVGDPVIIFGTNLIGSTNVTFNGTAATFNILSPSEISTSVPFGANTGPVQVTTPRGTLTSNIDFVVTPSYTLTVSTVGSGTVASTDGFISCPGTCSHLYGSNKQVTLIASPAQGWAFSGWTGACMGNGACQVTTTQDLAATAIFIEPGPGNGVQFVAATPCRLVDTRNSNPIQGNTSENFMVPQLGGCNIPSSAVAYSLNVTVAPHGRLGYLTIWPTGEARPYVSTMNSPDGRVKANAAIVPAGDSGAVSVYVSDTSDVILDIDGYFAPPAQNTYQFYPLRPCRVVDTRDAHQPQGLGPPSFGGMETRDLPILTSPCVQNLPQHAQAYSFNATVVPKNGGPLSYLTLWPSDQQRPLVSTLNNPTATVVANAAIVPASASNGNVKVFASNSTDLIMDINGYFAPPGQNGYSFYPVAPCRVLDTRQAGDGQPFQNELTINVVGSPCAPPSSATAYVMNATVVPSGFLDYLTLWPDGQLQPFASTLNANDGLITSNMAITPTTNGSIDAYASQLTHLIMDISGYFAP